MGGCWKLLQVPVGTLGTALEEGLVCEREASTE